MGYNLALYYIRELWIFENQHYYAVQSYRSIGKPTVNAIMECNCYICGKSFSSDLSFSNHILNSHGKENQVKCSSCGKEFESKNKLEVHVMVTHPHEDDELSDEEIGEDEAALKLRWVKGYNHSNPNNPGILIVNEESRFAFNKTTGNGLVLHYHCLRKSTTKCKAKCTLVCETALIDNVEKTKYRVELKLITIIMTLMNLMS